MVRVEGFRGVGVWGFRGLEFRGLGFGGRYRVLALGL